MEVTSGLLVEQRILAIGTELGCLAAHDVAGGREFLGRERPTELHHVRKGPPRNVAGEFVARQPVAFHLLDVRVGAELPRLARDGADDPLGDGGGRLVDAPPRVLVGTVGTHAVDQFDGLVTVDGLRFVRVLAHGAATNQDGYAHQTCSGAESECRSGAVAGHHDSGVSLTVRSGRSSRIAARL